MDALLGGIDSCASVCTINARLLYCTHCCVLRTAHVFCFRGRETPAGHTYVPYGSSCGSRFGQSLISILHVSPLYVLESSEKKTGYGRDFSLCASHHATPILLVLLYDLCLVLILFRR